MRRSRFLLVILLVITFSFSSLFVPRKVEASAVAAGFSLGSGGAALSGAAAGAGAVGLAPWILLATVIVGGGYVIYNYGDDAVYWTKERIAGLASIMRDKVAVGAEDFQPSEWVENYGEYNSEDPKDNKPMKIKGDKFRAAVISAGLATQAYLSANPGELEGKFYPNPFGKVVPLQSFYQNANLSSTYYSTVDIPGSNKTVYSILGISESLIDFPYDTTFSGSSMKIDRSVTRVDPSKRIQVKDIGLPDNFYIVYDNLQNTYTEHYYDSDYPIVDTRYRARNKIQVGNLYEFFISASLDLYNRGHSILFQNFVWSQHLNGEQGLIDFVQNTTTERQYDLDAPSSVVLNPSPGREINPEDEEEFLAPYIPSSPFYMNPTAVITLPDRQRPELTPEEFWERAQDEMFEREEDAINDGKEKNPNWLGPVPEFGGGGPPGSGINNPVINKLIPFLPGLVIGFTTISSHRVPPPVIKINLHEIFDASVGKIPAFNIENKFEDKETVLFDFGFFNEFSFAGVPLIDYFRNLIWITYYIRIFLYFWVVFLKEEVL